MASSIDPAEAGPSKAPTNEGIPTTAASFAPVQTSSYSSTRNTVIIHQKSPLLIATPPQVTRALAYSHPFLLPLNKLAGLLSWSTGDPWESFIFCCLFWATALYGDVLILYAGPVLLIVGLMLGMYTRRYSPLSTYASPVANTKDHRRNASSSSAASNIDVTSSSNQKSLDDIIDTLNTLTLRCNTLLEPFLKLTDFLSTQHSATSASTKPALVMLLYRMVGFLPIWIILSLSPIHIISARRVVFIVGTIIITWHSKPARVCRTLLWRSLFVRQTCTILTGFDFADVSDLLAPVQGSDVSGIRKTRSQNDLAAKRLAGAGLNKGERVGVRFTFTLFENQRRWVGIGWTTTLFAYERAPWTDDHLNASSDKDSFKLPKVEGAGAAWQWVEGSEWHVEPINTDGSSKGKGKFAPSSVSLRGRGGAEEGWIYYDNGWTGGRAQDGWGRYTRRRKWVRVAELVEVPTEEDAGKAGTAHELSANDDTSSMKKRRGLFGRRQTGESTAKKSEKSEKSGGSVKSVNEDDDKSTRRLNEDGEDDRSLQREAWDVGDDMKMGLG